VSPRSASALAVVALALCASAARAEVVPATSSAVGATPPANAGAEPCLSGDDDTTCGRRQFEAGTRAFERGEFEVARRAFQAALSLRPHPVIRYNLALSWARLGKPSAALAELRLVLAEANIDKDLRARSERELRLAEQAQAHVSFTLSDPEHDRLEFDGAPVAVTSRELVVDPGPHRARIISGSAVVLDQDLELAPSERVELRVGQRSRRIDVVVVPDPKEAASGSGTRRETTPQGSTRRGVSPAWFVVATGTTAVLTGLTIWSGLDTQRALSDYNSQLPTLTQAEADRRVREGHSRELRTNLLLSGSLLAAAGTAVLGLWFVDFGAGRTASVALGTGQLSVTARF